MKNYSFWNNEVIRILNLYICGFYFLSQKKMSILSTLQGKDYRKIVPWEQKLSVS